MVSNLLALAQEMDWSLDTFGHDSQAMPSLNANAPTVVGLKGKHAKIVLTPWWGCVLWMTMEIVKYILICYCF